MEELKPKHFQAAMMLATGMASKDVARELKVAQETISQWKKIRHFMQSIKTFVGRLSKVPEMV